MKTSWDDYRMFLYVAESGSLYAASKRLKVNHTTVFRRINALEDKLKTKLFERNNNGYILTNSGVQLFEELKEFDEKINNASLKIIGRDISLRGKVKLAASDTLGFLVLPKLLKKFNQLYPEIFVELIISPQVYDLSKREADIALRVSKNPSQYLFGKLVGKVDIGVFSGKKYKAKKTLDESFEKDSWVVGVEQLENHDHNRWLLQKSTGKNFISGGNHMIAIASLVQSNLGLGVIPIYLSKILPNLKLLHKVSELESKLWILTHQDLKNNCKVRALMDFLSKELKEVIKYDKN
jgi:DNA-binding transcriptional LysR family regulator